MSEIMLQSPVATLGISDIAAAQNWHWSKVTAKSVSDSTTLANLLALDPDALGQRITSNDFRLRVPLTFVSRMQPGSLSDPLLCQILPDSREALQSDDCTSDPLNEKQSNVQPGVVHKYRGRVLLTAAVSCPINCRYCFRRHFPYNENRLTPKTWQPALDYIRNDSTIHEVILSGGEPLLLNDETFSALFDELEAIGHIKFLRIHSRFPIAVPQRLTSALCERLSMSRCKVTLVLHSNHANEIDEHVKLHLQALVTSPVTLLNQSVLLRGINDNSQTLTELSEALFEAGVLPYYLHATDPVAGTTHFQVNDTKARKLAKAMTECLPGYLVPTLVREISGQRAKTRLPL